MFMPNLASVCCTVHSLSIRSEMQLVVIAFERFELSIVAHGVKGEDWVSGFTCNIDIGVGLCRDCLARFLSIRILTW